MNTIVFKCIKQYVATKYISSSFDIPTMNKNIFNYARTKEKLIENISFLKILFYIKFNSLIFMKKSQAPFSYQVIVLTCTHCVRKNRKKFLFLQTMR